MSIRLLCTLTGTAMAVGPAIAADMPVKAPVHKAPAVVSSWGGFYVGAGVGFRSSETNVNVDSATDTTEPPGLQNRFVGASCFSGLPCVTGRPFNGTAFRVSPYFGYNWQLGRTVLGLEADFGFADQTSSLMGMTYPATPFRRITNANSFLVKTSWDASIRGRAGYLVDPAVLLYGTAGPSWIHVQTTSNCSTDPAAPDGDCAPGGFAGFAPASISHSHTQLGYTVGGGIEALLWPNWIARAEYRFADYGHFSNTDVRSVAGGTQTVSYDTAIKTHTATFGLAYKFGNTNVPGAASMAAYAAMPSDDLWSGVYFGVGAGIRANQTTGRLDAATVAPVGFPSFDALAGCNCGLSTGFDSTSARLSPYIGYNWQLNQKWVVGLEGDFGFADRRTTHSGTYLPGATIVDASRSLNDSFSVRTKWDASIRGRAGYLVNPSFLAYLTGGVAWMSVEQTSRCATEARFDATAPGPGLTGADMGDCTPGLRTPAVISQSIVKPGFTIGGGGEMKLGSNWLLRGEYRYADFGSAHFNVARSCAGTATIGDPAVGTLTISCFQTDFAATSLRLQSHMATFGIAYKFN